MPKGILESRRELTLRWLLLFLVFAIRNQFKITIDQATRHRHFRYNRDLYSSYLFFGAGMYWGMMLGMLPLAVSLAILVLTAGLVKWFRSRHPRESPLTRDLLRPPGYSLQQWMSYQFDELMLNFMGAMVSPISVYAVHLSQSYLGGDPENPVRIAISVTLGLVLCGFFCWRIWKQSDALRLATIGLDGEEFVGEELNQLMLLGCRVFHDIPYQYGNIDHVVVSSSGVHSINTKTLGKPIAGDAKAVLLVDYSRNRLCFPDREVPLPHTQLETEAKWLAEYLTSAVGRPVQVEPMLALPGWFIKRTGESSLCVFNPFNAAKFFLREKTTLTADQVQQIAHQLERLCRDRKPSFRTDKAWPSK